MIKFDSDYESTWPCVCSHIEGYHAFDDRVGWHCGDCGVKCNQGFKLDNLAYVEMLAKQKGLV